ncbi:MAG: hypothetical protein JXA04_09705 [Gammaproteobacteria bacterium]|nr:hypothetical protein [Gammaproteobacteria bacterium]
MEIHDLALYKYGAGREKDLLFTKALANAGLTDKETLLGRLGDINADRNIIDLIRARIEASFIASRS